MKRSRENGTASATLNGGVPSLAELLPTSAIGPASATSGTHAKRPKLYQGEDAEEDGAEFFSKLRISKRTVPSQDVRMALAGRTVHRIKTLADGPASRFTPPGGAESRAGADWVTIGVLASRSAPQIGRTGNAYATWRLTDFHADVTVLLFGEAYETHKLSIMEGSIVLLSHPVVLPAKERSSFALSVSSGAQLTKLGTCPVFAICKANRKDGNRCTMVRGNGRSRASTHTDAGRYIAAAATVETPLFCARAGLHSSSRGFTQVIAHPAHVPGLESRLLVLSCFCMQAVNTEVNQFCVHHMAGEYARLMRQVTAGRGDMVGQPNCE